MDENTDISALKSEGFTGFYKVASLMQNGCAHLPEKPGVYMALNPNMEKSFLPESVGGHFKGKNPTVSLGELEENWVDDAVVLYIGQTARTLKKRVDEYMRFGKGKRVGHRGGRLIWQLENHRDLIICFRVDDNPRALESVLLEKFKRNYGSLPFANLQK